MKCAPKRPDRVKFAQKVRQRRVLAFELVAVKVYTMSPDVAVRLPF